MARLSLLSAALLAFASAAIAAPQILTTTTVPVTDSVNTTTCTTDSQHDPSSECEDTCMADCLSRKPSVFLQVFPESCYLPNRNRLECAKECGLKTVDVVDCEDANLKRVDVRVRDYFKMVTVPLWESGEGDGIVGNEKK